MEFVLKTRANSSASQYVTSSQRSSPQAISHAIRPVSTLVSLISHGFPSAHGVHASVSLPPNGALPKLFPTVSRPSTMMSTLPSCSLTTELSDGSRCPRFRLAPSQRNSPRAISDGFPSELSPSYFPRLPVRPPCRRFRPRQSKLNENASIGDAFGKKTITMAF